MRWHIQPLEKLRVQLKNFHWAHKTRFIFVICWFWLCAFFTLKIHCDFIYLQRKCDLSFNISMYRDIMFVSQINILSKSGNDYSTTHHRRLRPLSLNIKLLWFFLTSFWKGSALKYKNICPFCGESTMSQPPMMSPQQASSYHPIIKANDCHI